MCRTSVALGTFCIIFLILAAASLASDALITVDSGVYEDTQATVECIKAYGGRVKIVIFPDIIIAEMPKDVDARVLAHSEASAVHRGILEPEDFREGRKHFITAWNNVYMGQAHLVGLDAEPSPDRRPLVNDVVPFEEIKVFYRPPGAKLLDVSEFMLGTASLAVILPESDGSIDAETEDWTQTEKDQVTSEIINGLNWYVEKAQWRDLTFYTVFYYDVPTGYEPIRRPSTQEYLWRDQCIAALGYAGTYDMANGVRDNLGTDWATLCFIADSSEDPDNTFPDGRFAYSTLGGPRFIMTYGNDGWGIGNMDAVAAHELSHSYYALDEYQSAGEGCAARSGYLNFENQNSCYPGGCGACSLNVFFCIMRSVGISAARVCNYTKGQIGWTDTDDDSIPDIMDTICETILFEYSPDPCTTTTPAYAGSCWVERLPNLNPRNSRKNAITLAMIENVELRVDGGPWENASPADGAWDLDKEAFNFTTSPLSVGTHVIEARAQHTYGNYDTTFGVDTLTVDPGAGVEREVGLEEVFVSAYPNPFEASVHVRYSVPGTYGSSVPVTLKVFDVRGREVTALVSGPAGPGEKSVAWDGTYSNGKNAPSGIYFFELVAGRARVIKKVVMTR